MSSQSLTTFGLIALMAVAFYFLILRPQRKRQQDQQKTMNAITPGSRVMTGSGLFGTVVSVGEKQIVIEISPGVNLTLLKPAVSRVVGPEDEDSPAPLDFDAHYEPETSKLDLPRSDPQQASTQQAYTEQPPTPQGHIEQSYGDDLGPSASDVTPGRTNQTPGNDPSTKE
jgi:preprotein translocase subunit YajC